MSSSSPNHDARRTNATLLGKRIEQTKGGERSEEVGRWCEETGGKKRESLSSSDDDDDSNSAVSVQPMKKSMGTTGGRMSGGTRSVVVLRGAKGTKRKKSCAGASAAKGKKTQNYNSDDFSSSSDDSIQKSMKGKHSIKDLLKTIEEKDKIIRLLDLKLTTKGDLKNEQDKGERGVEVEGRGDKHCRDGELLLSEFSFFQIQVPQGWMEGNYA